MFEEIRGILSKQLEIPEEEITGESDLQADLEADSLDVMEIVMEIEDIYGIEVDDDDIVKMKTLDDIVAYIQEKQNA